MPHTPQPSCPAADPSREDIARRAYEIYCTANSEDGHDVDHWLQAEQELRASREPRAVPKPDRRTGRHRAVRAEKRTSQAAAPDKIG